MSFKFLKEEQVPDVPEHITQERFQELVAHQLDNPFDNTNFFEPQPEYNRLTTDNRPAAFLTINLNRNEVSDEQMTALLRQQRTVLIEQMWEQGMIVQTIVSQDEFGFTLRSELNF